VEINLGDWDMSSLLVTLLMELNILQDILYLKRQIQVLKS